jgi:hypothetical protein
MPINQQYIPEIDAVLIGYYLDAWTDKGDFSDEERNQIKSTIKKMANKTTEPAKPKDKLENTGGCGCQKRTKIEW